MPLLVGHVGGYGGGSRRRAFSCCRVCARLSLATGAGLALRLPAYFLPTDGLWRTILIAMALVAGLSLLGGRGLPGLRGGRCDSCGHAPDRWKGVLGAFIAGALSGFVFAPCATPVMVGILALIGNQQDVLLGTLLMFLYSLGHGALLLAAGSSVGFAQWMAQSHWAGRVNWLFTRLAGALLVGYAIYLAAGMAGWLG
jgi:cytochrome c biogenesis protein CcdA